jgi:superfamily II DNA/RNA helicase
VQVLVATDIASRGIDVEGITHVINYDVPHAPEDYVHRIGRTGRVDAVGDAFTLISPEEMKQLTAIERFLGRAVPRVILPDFDYKRRSADPRPAERRLPERGPSGRRPSDRGPGSERSSGRRPDHAGGRAGGRSGNSQRGHGREPGSAGNSGQVRSQSSSGQAGNDQNIQQHGRRPKKSHGLDRRGRRRI